MTIKKSALQHYGILGMKWGRRKTQVVSSDDHKNVSRLKKKKIQELSNKELKEIADRLELERKYKTLNPSKTKKTAKTVDGALTTLAKLSAAVGSIAIMVATGKKIISFAEKQLEFIK